MWERLNWNFEWLHLDQGIGIGWMESPLLPRIPHNLLERPCLPQHLQKCHQKRWQLLQLLILRRLRYPSCCPKQPKETLLRLFQPEEEEKEPQPTLNLQAWPSTASLFWEWKQGEEMAKMPLILQPLAFHFEERIWGPGCWTIFFPIFITKKNRKNVTHRQ